MDVYMGYIKETWHDSIVRRRKLDVARCTYWILSNGTSGYLSKEQGYYYHDGNGNLVLDSTDCICEKLYYHERMQSHSNHGRTIHGIQSSHIDGQGQRTSCF